MVRFAHRCLTAAVLGVGIDVLAFEPTQWNRRSTIAEAIRRQIAGGGLVTLDWHAASCGAELPPSELLGTVDRRGSPGPRPRVRER